MMQLRPYQQAAVRCVYEHLRAHDDNPCCIIPTGGGKTPVIATICKDAVTKWNGRVLILAHVKELIEQAVEKLQLICPELDVGVYSAGLRRRDTDHSVIVAGIQSIYRRACELDAFDLIVIDEAHMIPTEGDGMYREFLADAQVVNPRLRVIGMTATPFRLKSGQICRPDHFLNSVCYEVGVKELIRDGYLCPLVTKTGTQKADTSVLHVRRGEFIASETEELMDQEILVRSACQEIVSHTQDRQSCLIFTSGVKHGRHIVKTLQDNHGVECGFVCGETLAGERDELLQRFKQGQLKYLANVNVLTTGFDAPSIDCVAMLRPTLSPGLYYQMVGRGFRLHPDKQDCLVLDFGGNVLLHGPVDQIKIREPDSGSGEAPVKECLDCQALVATGYTACPHCGCLFPPPQRQQHEAKATEAGILSGKILDKEHKVRDVFYSVHSKNGAGEEAPKTMRVDYQVGWHKYKPEWICFEHEGYAQKKAAAWWQKRSLDPVPLTVEHAVDIANAGGVAMTEEIKVRNVAGEPYDRIIDYTLGEMPQPAAVCEVDNYNSEEIPF